MPLQLSELAKCIAQKYSTDRAGQGVHEHAATAQITRPEKKKAASRHPAKNMSARALGPVRKAAASHHIHCHRPRNAHAPAPNRDSMLSIRAKADPS